MSKYLTEKAQKKRWWDYPVILASGLLGCVGVNSLIRVFDSGEPVVSVLTGILGVGALVVPAVSVILRLRRQSNARKIAKRLETCMDAAIPFDALEKRIAVSGAEKKVRKLIARGYLHNLAIDVDQRCVRLAGSEWTPGSDRPIPQTGNENYDAKLAEIRQLNDEIKNWKVSNRIDRIEELTASIFRTISEKPDRADDARRFMNYYLPTTLKLLESYKLMEKQSYQGENIQVSRKKIEAVLDTMIRAMEGQQDKLFRSDVLDVETDITVLETMMSSDGFRQKGGELHS